jgi:hypothetical protein
VRMRRGEARGKQKTQRRSRSLGARDDRQWQGQVPRLLTSREILRRCLLEAPRGRSGCFSAAGLQRNAPCRQRQKLAPRRPRTPCARTSHRLEDDGIRQKTSKDQDAEGDLTFECPKVKNVAATTLEVTTRFRRGALKRGSFSYLFS